MTTIEDSETADWIHHRLEDAFNEAIHCLQQAKHHDIRQLDLKEGSTYTDRARKVLDVIEAHEGDLIDWQERQAEA